MTERMTPRAMLIAAGDFLGEPRIVTAVTTAAIGTSVCAFALRQVIGWAGLLGVLSVLVLLAGASIVARWRTIEWRGILPVSLLIFVGWAGVSLLWSAYRWTTLGSLAYLGAFTVLGLYVALLRDTIQIVRAFGDVLRFAISVSLAIEILAGVLIDSSIPLLDVGGHLGELGPIQGITGARNQLGILAVIALITFGTELRTKSVPRGLAIGSIAGAGITLLLTRSPVALGALVVVCVAAVALYGLRRVTPESRRFWQAGLLTVSVIAAAFAWAFRSVIVVALNAGGELSYRLDVWREAWSLVALHPLEGWGWIGRWHNEIQPFTIFASVSSRNTVSASNAYLDVWFQLGLVGLAIFVGMVGLAFVRSWLLASRQRSVVFAWPALVMACLIVTSLAESSMLVEFGWLTFVVCAVKAAEQLSWRQAFARLDQSGSA